MPPADLARQATILFGDPFTINGPMWSLVWEVWFSLLLSVFVAVVLLFGKRWWLGVVVGVLLIALNAFIPPYIGFLPYFLIGGALASGVEDIRRAARWVGRLRFRHAAWFALFALAIVLLPFDRYLRAMTTYTPGSIALGGILTTLGAILLVVGAAFCPAAITLLDSKPLRWLGRVSFSLYLIHWPVLLAVAVIIGDSKFAFAAVACVVASLVAAQLFFRFVEKPAHELSQTVGARFHRSRSADASPTREQQPR